MQPSSLDADREFLRQIGGTWESEADKYVSQQPLAPDQSEKLKEIFGEFVKNTGNRKELTIVSVRTERTNHEEFLNKFLGKYGKDLEGNIRSEPLSSENLKAFTELAKEAKLNFTEEDNVIKFNSSQIPEIKKMRLINENRLVGAQAREVLQPTEQIQMESKLAAAQPNPVGYPKEVQIARKLEKRLLKADRKKLVENLNAKKLLKKEQAPKIIQEFVAVLVHVMNDSVLLTFFLKPIKEDGPQTTVIISLKELDEILISRKR